MRRCWLACFAWAALLFFAGTACLHAQEEPTPKEMARIDYVGKWKIVNSALFFLAFGIFVAKVSPKFFNARSSDIQKSIQEATGLKLEADYRYSEIDRKMATLAEEVNRMRQEASGEMEREHARLQQETQEGIERIQHNVAAEIEAFRFEGAQKVRRNTTQAAFALAEQRLRDRLSSSNSEGLVQDFVHLVERGQN